MIYEEKCLLNFQNDSNDPFDQIYAIESDQNDNHFNPFQTDNQGNFIDNNKKQRSLSRGVTIKNEPNFLDFKHNSYKTLDQGEDGFGLPNYFGDLPPQLAFQINKNQNPLPIYIKNQKQPTISREQASKGWNNSIVPDSKFFDKQQDKDYLKKRNNATYTNSYDGQRKVRFQNQDLNDKNLIQVQKDFTGKNINVKFYTQGGRETQNIEIIKDIDQLNQINQSGALNQYKNYSLQKKQNEKKSRSGSRRSNDARKIYEGSPKRHGYGKIEIAGVSIDKNDARQISKIIKNNNYEKQLEIPGLDPNIAVKQTIADAKMSALMEQTLQQKSEIIKALQDELDREKSRRRQIGKDYHHQIKEYEIEKKAIEVLKKKSDQLEKKKLQKEKEIIDSELDMIPTRQKSTSKKFPQIQDQPIFFKNSKIESQFPKANTLNFYQKRKSSLKRIQSSGKISERQLQTIQKSTGRKNDKDENSKSESLLQQEFDATHKVLKKLRDNPNQHLGILSQEMQNLQDKLEPMIQRVEQAKINVEMARATHTGNFSSKDLTLRGLLSQQEGKIGMMARMGGKLIHFYQDELTELLLEDFLEEIVQDLQAIEQKERKKIVINQSKDLAENLLKHIVDFQSEQQLIEMKWKNNEIQQKKQGQQKIEFAENALDTVNFIKEQQPQAFKLKSGQNNFKSINDKYVNPFEAATLTGLSLNSQLILEKDNKNQEIEKIEHQIELIGGPNEVYQPQPRKYKLGGLSKAQEQSITSYREKYGKFLELHNNTRSREVWKIYDHISNELIRESINNVLESVVSQDIEKWLLEQVIIDEFQI